ncbi:MAG: hypothetical protein KKF48_00415 [Nanoarchaeota archaeon]|nr:hypothetical protein [Nanoarchaeota archaeon]MBU1027488.1 hypothetical protein [Nanoarchaeota archaeon]
MVREKLVRLAFDNNKKCLIISDINQVVINPVQLSGVVILKYDGYSGNEDRLKIRERNASEGANAYLGSHVIRGSPVAIGSDFFHPLIYYKIDDIQWRNASKREIVDSHYESLGGFDGEAD